MDFPAIQMDTSWILQIEGKKKELDKSHTVCKLGHGKIKYLGNTTNIHITHIHLELEELLMPSREPWSKCQSSTHLFLVYLNIHTVGETCWLPHACNLNHNPEKLAFAVFLIAAFVIRSLEIYILYVKVYDVYLSTVF